MRSPPTRLVHQRSFRRAQPPNSRLPVDLRTDDGRAHADPQGYRRCRPGRPRPRAAPSARASLPISVAPARVGAAVAEPAAEPLLGSARILRAPVELVALARIFIGSGALDGRGGPARPDAVTAVGEEGGACASCSKFVHGRRASGAAWRSYQVAANGTVYLLQEQDDLPPDARRVGGRWDRRIGNAGGARPWQRAAGP